MARHVGTDAETSNKKNYKTKIKTLSRRLRLCFPICTALLSLLSYQYMNDEAGAVQTGERPNSLVFYTENVGKNR
jgi:hypothetical protein